MQTETQAGRAAMPDTEAPLTWSVRLPVLIQVATGSDANGRRAATRELNEMAREADAARAMLAALRMALDWMDDAGAHAPWTMAQMRCAIALAERGA